MPRSTRQERRREGRQPRPRPRIAPPPTGPALGTQEVLHLSCPICSLQARLDLITQGPYDSASRLQHYGGSLPSPDGSMRYRPGVLMWEPAEPLTDDQVALLVTRMESALENLRTQPRYVPPTAPRRVPPPAPPPPPVVVVPPFTLGESPTRAAAQALIRHLELLEELGVDKPEVEAELERLADKIEPWVDEIGEAISEEEDKERPNQDRIDRLQEQLATVEEAWAALTEQDISTAMDALERAFIPTRPKAPPAKPRKVPKAPAPPIVERMEAQARTFRPRILALRERPDRAELERLEQEMTGLYDRVLDSAETATGEAKKRLDALAQRLERSAEAFALAYDALARGNIPAYLRALDALIECCPA